MAPEVQHGSTTHDGVAVDNSGNVYVADSNNSTVRKITPAGVVTTVAGRPGYHGSSDGIGSAAQFSPGVCTPRGPSGAAVDNAGNLYVTDWSNNRITKGTPVLQFDTSAGSLTISNGFFQMRLTWTFATNVVVEASTNLQSWTPIQINHRPPPGPAKQMSAPRR